MKEDFLEIDDLDGEELTILLDLADKIKAKPSNFATNLNGKTLLMIFQKPSLRTRVSFEVGMTQLGGHAIYYDISTSPLGKGKETIADTARTASRYVDIIMARLFEHKDICELATNSDVPVINALTNDVHPCQILADLQTIREKKGKLKGLKVAYLGDAKNNVAHSLIKACYIFDMKLNVGCPDDSRFKPDYVNSNTKIMHNAIESVKDADVVCTDSWMSYHIKPEEKAERIKILTPYQVNSELMKHAKKDAIFIHCLPATRGQEVTSEVIDGPQSVVFDEAENRLHTEKALLLWLLDRIMVKNENGKGV